MVSYNSVFDELQYYILDETNMKNFLTIKKNDKILKMENHVKPENTLKLVNSEKKYIDKPKKHDNKIFIPNQKDTLFWCFYIITQGEFSYEQMLNKNFLVAKQMKIELIKNIRENKDKIKKFKFNSLSNIEDNLANQDNLNISAFLSLCVAKNINIFFIRKKTYYELVMDNTENIYIIYQYDSYTPYRYGFEISTPEKIEDIRKNFYNIDSVEKPVKSLTYYKLSDLIEICNKLAIELSNPETGKKKTKNDLYQSIIQYF